MGKGWYGVFGYVNRIMGRRSLFFPCELERSIMELLDLSQTIGFGQLLEREFTFLPSW